MTKVLDKGFIELVAHCADDLSVVNAARVSFNEQVSEMSERDEGLIRFLMREHHGTPFEHGFFKFRVKAPIFVFREWHRHRVGHSYNEWSARYSKMEADFYIPDELVTQTGKPGAYTYETLEGTAFNFIAKAGMQKVYIDAYREYERLMEMGIAKQQARAVLPVATYSQMIWSCNPRSLMHFLNLRNSANAQYEIRCYAVEAEKIFREIMPVTAQAFVDFGRQVP